MYNATCPGCGEKAGENELSPLKYIVSRAFRGDSLKYRENTRMRIGKYNYCAKCANDFDAWYIKCANCGKKKMPSGSVKIDGKFYCRECITDKKIGMPADIRGEKICINISEFTTGIVAAGGQSGWSMNFTVPLTGKTPTLPLIVNHNHLLDYVLETKDDEDFTGKYFHMMIRMYRKESLPPIVQMMENLGMKAPGTSDYASKRVLRFPVQIDGFISDTPDERTMSGNDIGYRFEGLMLSELGNMISSSKDGLAAKGLRYPGYITPGNVRLIGVCPECRKSMCFKSYNFPMMQAEPIYSDDGTDVYTLYDMDGSFDRENGTIESGGKIFRFKNDFRCRHCGATYIDYKNSPAKSHYGLYGCAFLDRDIYRD